MIISFFIFKGKISFVLLILNLENIFSTTGKIYHSLLKLIENSLSGFI